MIYKQNENGRTKTNITKILGSRLKLGFSRITCIL